MGARRSSSSAVALDSDGRIAADVRCHSCGYNLRALSPIGCCPDLSASLILAGLGIVIVLQNTESVETKLLFITVTMPRAVLLFTTTMVGFALGVLVALILSGKRKQAGS